VDYPPLPLTVLPRTKTKLLAQRDYYNAREDRLGDKFYGEMLDALTWLQTNYNAPPFVKGRQDIQRLVTTTGSFRWLIYFRVKNKEIVVPSITHPSQRPRY
jgi:hypothetical protein